MLLAWPAWGASTGQVLLKGTVPSLASIVVNAEPIASALPLNVSQNRTLVATSVETWNSHNGAKVQVSSLNQGFLVHETITSSKIAYVLRYRNFNVNLASGEIFNTNQPGPRTLTRDLEISYTGVPHASLFEGDYTDIVTLTISSN